MRAPMITGPARWLAMAAVGVLSTGAVPAAAPKAAPAPNAAPILPPAAPAKQPAGAAAAAAAAAAGTAAIATAAPGGRQPSAEVQAAVQKANGGHPEDLYKLADNGDPDAQFFAGGILIFGLGQLPRDPAKGCAYEEKAGATRGDAMHLVGECYRRGLAGHLDKAKAASAYEKAIAMGYSQSKCVLGDMLFGDPAQAARGLKLCREAADAGDVAAQAKIAGFYYRGAGTAVKSDKTQARKYYELAAKGGNNEARRKLGEMYAKGEGGKADEKKAMEVWTAAEKAGDPMVSILVADHLFLKVSGGKPPGPGQFAFKGGIPVADIEVVEDWYKQAQARDPRPDVQQRAKYALSVLAYFKTAAKQASGVSTTKASSKGGKPPPGKPPASSKPPPPPPKP